MIRAITQVSLGEQVAGQLREAILSGQFSADTHLSEEALAVTFSVSRGPVRDAIRQLVVEGLVGYVGNRARVMPFGEKDITDLYELREGIETIAVREVCRCRDQVQWTALDEALGQMATHADAGDAAGYALADLYFHDQIYQATQNRRLQRMWQQLLPTFEVLVKITTSQDVDLGPSHASHEELLRLLRAGAATDLETELRQHLLGAKNRMIRAHQALVLDALDPDDQ